MNKSSHTLYNAKQFMEIVSHMMFRSRSRSHNFQEHLYDS